MKHLYQSVTIDFSKVRSLLPKLEQEIFQCDYAIVSHNRLPGEEQVNRLKQQIRQDVAGKVQHWINGEWILVDEKSAAAFKNDLERVNAARFSLPSVKVFCTECNSGPWPHIPARESDAKGFSFESSEEKPNIQVFSIPFQCQNCKKESRSPLVFFIRREGLKLTLVGRSQFPEVLVPDYIPKEQRGLFRNAVIVFQANFSLAATLYLRCLIEQHFYQTISPSEIEALKQKGSPRGEELAELYAKTLPKGFPNEFPSLRKAYDDLSAVLHRGKEDENASKTFQEVKLNIEKHFDALRVFNSILKK